jgi:hypothetical protein
MVGVHSVSGGLDVGQVVRMAWSTTMTPGVDGELALAAHPEVTPVRRMLTFTAIETGTQTNIR